MADEADLLKWVNDSGYPLQIAVERAVSAARAEHGWTARYREHAWQNQLDGSSGFIDLVLQDQHKTTYLVVECKRVRDTAWIFMDPRGRAESRRHAKFWVTRYVQGTYKYFGWVDNVLDPAAPEATFCTVRGKNSNDKLGVLERVCGELVSSTEALAVQERGYHPKGDDSIRLYFNVLVTTAELKVARFDAGAISLADGTIPEATFIDVPFVRFRKQLSSRPLFLTDEHHSDGADPAYDMENTVFVIRADALNSFLQELEVPDELVHRFR